MVEEVIKIGNNCQSKEVHHDLNVLSLLRQSYVIHDLHENYHTELEEASKKCKFVANKLPWMVQCVLHEIKTLFDFTLQVYMQQNATEEPIDNNPKVIWLLLE